jgi:hypothetical protein
MAHDSNGHIYVDTQNDIGIGIQEVNTVLGAGSLDLATLCRSPRVNTYAKCKPNGATAVAQQTIAQRQAVNCGIDCSDTSTGCFSADLTALLARAKALFDWQKVTPTICRLLDFDGYEHNASCPYEPITDIIGNTTGDATMNATIILRQVVESGNDQISDLVEALTRKGNAVGDFTRGLLVRDASDTSIAPTIVPTTGSSQYVFPAPADYAHPVTYDCVFIDYVLNGTTYWAVFYPRTYFQAKMALFYVSEENNTLQFPKAGGEVEMIISGYNWQATWGGKGNPNADIVMSLSPGQGGTTSPWSSVRLNVARSTYRSYTSTSVTKAITVSAPGQVGMPGDFTKTFYVTQACDMASSYIALVDENDEDAGSEVVLTRLYIEAEKAIRIRADRSWKIADQNTSQGAGIVYRIAGDDSGTYYDGRNDISVTSSATIPTGTHTTKTVYIVNLKRIPVNRRYEVLFVSLDGTAAFRLYITPAEE